MKNDELQLYGSIVEILEETIDGYLEVAANAKRAYIATGEVLVDNDDFEECVRLVPFFLMSEVVNDAGKAEEFQVSILKKLFVKYSISYTVSDFIKFSISKEGTAYEKFRNKISVSENFCAKYWRIIFDMIFSCGDGDLLSQIASALSSVPLWFQAPMGTIIEKGDNREYMQTPGGQIITVFLEELLVHAEKYRQEMMAKQELQ